MAITQTRTWEQVLSTTLDNYMPRMYDNVSKHIPLLFELSAAGNIQMQPGGAQIVVPLLTGLNTTAKVYNDGDTLDVTAQTGIEAAQYVWKQFACTIVIYGGQMMKNQLPHQVLSLVTAKVEQGERSMWDLLDNSTQGLFSNNGDVSTGLTGLQSLISTTPTVGTVGNISRAANTFWQNQLGTAISSWATNGLSRLRTAYYSCVRGKEHPNLLVTNSTGFTNYINTLTASLRYMLPFTGTPATAKRLGDAGFTNVQFEEAAMIFDFYCPASTTYLVNTNVLKLIGMEGRVFTNSVWINRADQDALTARILFMGELVATDMQRLGVITGTDNA